jgi:MYND finger
VVKEQVFFCQFIKEYNHPPLYRSIMDSIVTTTPNPKVCSVCNVPCPNSLKCGHCKNVQYCSKACQSKNWPEHKTLCVQNVELVDLVQTVWTILLDPLATQTKLCYYHGTKMIKSNLRVWFFEELCYDTNLEEAIEIAKTAVSTKSWYTSGQCLKTGDGLKASPNTKPMTEKEFYEYWTTGKCSVYSFAFGVVLQNMVQNSRRKFVVTFCGIPIKEVYLVSCTNTKKFPESVNCYEPFPITPADKPIESWDCDYLTRKKHQFLSVELNNGDSHFIDITGPQYGIANNHIYSGYEHPFYAEKKWVGKFGNDHYPHGKDLVYHPVLEAWGEINSKKVAQSSENSVEHTKLLIELLRKRLNC